MFNAASTLGGFGWRFESTRKAFQKLDNEIRASVAREGKARKAARHDEIIISSFDPGESGKANCKLVNEQLEAIIRWNKKLKVNEEKPGFVSKGLL